MSGSSFIRLRNAFVFPDPQTTTINILDGWSEISG